MREQRERTRAFFEFAHAPGGVMLCTDVCARGLDLPNVDWIVQYDPPDDVATFVHRVGRAARLGHKGHSLLFLTGKEMPYLEVLEQRVIQLKGLDLVNVLRDLNFKNAPERGGLAAGGGKVETPGSLLQRRIEGLVAASQPSLVRAKTHGVF